jgi:hypothetical protein
MKLLRLSPDYFCSPLWNPAVDIKNFRFSDLARDRPKDSFVAILPAHIATVNDLFNELARVLCFPAYFGRNWNALYDCLTDFHWISGSCVCLIHLGLPAMLDDELRIYLNILNDSIADWRSHGEDKLSVYFGIDDRRTISDL